MKKRIAILTATRAEYGLLKPLMEALLNDDFFDVDVLVTGVHLSEDFGLTYKEIENDGIPISAKIEILSGEDSALGMSKTMANAVERFAEWFSKNPVDGLIVLGDRYETLAVCCAATNERIPIFHLHGGETTEGAIDEAVRHSITKMSYLHFTSNEMHRKRVVQLGENPKRVFNVGAIGVENVLKTSLLSKEELSESLGMDLSKPYAVATFHPVTLENASISDQFFEFVGALNELDNLQYIITKANADSGGKLINVLIDEYEKTKDNVHVYTSLGMKRYLSAVKYADVVIGNSSSGIIEVPSFHVPTVNVGDRQRGRMQAESVINCVCEKEAIKKSIKKALSAEFQQSIQDVKNPYEGNGTTETICKVIRDVLESSSISLKKSFYDVSFEV